MVYDPSIKPILREATIKDVKYLARMNVRAFADLPVENYFAGLTHPCPVALDSRECKMLFKYFVFLFKRCFYSRCRITMLVYPDAGGKIANGSDTIVASTIWRPPTSTQGYRPQSTVKAFLGGFIGLMWGWGIGLLPRVNSVLRPNEIALEEGYKSRNISSAVEDSWYLQLAAVDPDYQGRGFLSILMRDAFEHAPGHHFTLEGSTPRSRDRYANYGFEVVKEVTIGKGKVDVRGILVPKDVATGFPMFPMIK